MRRLYGLLVAFAACQPSEASEAVDLGPAPVSQLAPSRPAAINPRLLRRFRPNQGALPRSRWDAFLEGDHSTLTTTELRGLRLFSDRGCIECHTGELPLIRSTPATAYPESVRRMGKQELGIELTDGEVASIIAWFSTFTAR